MPHRDETEASRARADALAREVEELKAERDALTRENEKLKKGPPKPEPPPPTPTPTREEKRDAALEKEEQTDRRAWMFGLGIGGVFIIGIASLIIHSERVQARKMEAYQQAQAEYDQVQGQWHYAQRFEPCVRRAELGGANLRERVPTTWGADTSTRYEAPHRQCDDDAKRIADDATLPAAARDAARAWVTAEADLDAKAARFNDYFSERDFKEDQFKSAPGLWAEVNAALVAQSKAASALARDTFPAVREKVRDNQRREEVLHGKSQAWWSIELGLEYWQLGETAIGASGIRDGKPIDRAAIIAAIKAPTAAWVLHADKAPIEIRRIVRAADYWTDPLAHGGALRPEIAWDVISVDVDPIGKLYSEAPGLPPKPERPPDDD